MKNIIVALAAAVTLAAALPSSAQAHCRGCGVAAGVVGGLAAGAIIGSALANSGPTYVEPAPVYAPPRLRRAASLWRRSGLSYRTSAGVGRLRLSHAPRRGLRLVPASSCPALCRASTSFSLCSKVVDSRDKPGHDKRTHRRMCSSTAAVGQQSTFNPFFFWYAPSAARVSMPALPSILSL